MVTTLLADWCAQPLTLVGAIPRVWCLIMQTLIQLCRCPFDSIFEGNLARSIVVDLELHLP